MKDFVARFVVGGFADSAKFAKLDGVANLGRSTVLGDESVGKSGKLCEWANVVCELHEMNDRGMMLKLEALRDCAISSILLGLAAELGAEFVTNVVCNSPYGGDWYVTVVGWRDVDLSVDGDSVVLLAMVDYYDGLLKFSSVPDHVLPSDRMRVGFGGEVIDCFYLDKLTSITSHKGTNFLVELSDPDFVGLVRVGFEGFVFRVVDGSLFGR